MIRGSFLNSFFFAWLSFLVCPPSFNLSYSPSLSLSICFLLHCFSLVLLQWIFSYISLWKITCLQISLIRLHYVSGTICDVLASNIKIRSSYFSEISNKNRNDTSKINCSEFVFYYWFVLTWSFSSIFPPKWFHKQNWRYAGLGFVQGWGWSWDPPACYNNVKDDAI